jgi:hypothetical protein
MTTTLYDWRNASHCRVHYHDSLEAAEEHAIQLMDEIKHLLPTKAWGRGEFAHVDYQEYTERNCVGFARVYVRIIHNAIPHKCNKCDAPESHQIRAGEFCDKHYNEYIKEYSE